MILHLSGRDPDALPCCTPGSVTEKSLLFFVTHLKNMKRPGSLRVSILVRSFLMFDIYYCYRPYACRALLCAGREPFGLEEELTQFKSRHMRSISDASQEKQLSPVNDPFNFEGPIVDITISRQSLFLLSCLYWYPTAKVRRSCIEHRASGTHFNEIQTWSQTGVCQPLLRMPNRCADFGSFVHTAETAVAVTTQTSDGGGAGPTDHSRIMHTSRCGCDLA